MGTEAARNAAPDGYMLLVGTIGTHTVNQFLFRSLSYDPLADFVPITKFSHDTNVVAVPPASPFRTLQDPERFPSWMNRRGFPRCVGTDSSGLSAGKPTVMAKALSVDLRDRVVAAVAGGASCRAAAARFGVSASSAIRWCSRQREAGSVAPGPLGGDRRSARLEAQAALILGLVEREPDATLAEIRAALAEAGVQAGIGTL